MDLLTGYGSASDEEQEEQAPQPVKPAGKTAQVAKAAAATVALPNPFADGPSGSTSSASKRPYTAVVGHSLPTAASKAKASKVQAAAGPAAKPEKPSIMLPPQLAGRANVVTEDLEKLFTRKTVGGKVTGVASTADERRSNSEM